MTSHTPKPPEAIDLAAIDAMQYNPITGEVVGVSGKVIGREENGRIVIDAVIRRFKRAHIAWYKTYGVWPSKLLDHKNRNKLDDRIENLRESDPVQNCINNDYVLGRDLPPGISKQRSGSFVAKLKRQGRLAYLGTYKDLSRAIEVLEQARLLWDKSPELSVYELRANCVN